METIRADVEYINGCRKRPEAVYFIDGLNKVRYPVKNIHGFSHGQPVLADVDVSPREIIKLAGQNAFYQLTAPCNATNLRIDTSRVPMGVRLDTWVDFVGRNEKELYGFAQLRKRDNFKLMLDPQIFKMEVRFDPNELGFQADLRFIGERIQGELGLYEERKLVLINIEHIVRSHTGSLVEKRGENLYIQVEDNSEFRGKLILAPSGSFFKYPGSSWKNKRTEFNINPLRRIATWIKVL